MLLLLGGALGLLTTWTWTVGHSQVRTQAGDMSDTEELFDLAAWETRNGLNRKTTEALSKEDYASLAVLRAMTASDVAALNITGGQARTLKLALGGLGNPAFRPSAPTTQPRETAVTEAVGPAAAVEMEGDDSGRAILQAGEMLDALWAGDGDGETKRALGNVAGYQAPDKDKWGDPASYDPTMLLTMKASTKKACQVTAFVPESVKQRLIKKRREAVVGRARQDCVFEGGRVPAGIPDAGGVGGGQRQVDTPPHAGGRPTSG